MAKFSNGLTTFSTTSTQVTIDFGSCLKNYSIYCDAINSCGSTPQFYKYVEVGVPGSSPCNQGAALKISPNPVLDKIVNISIIGGDSPCYYDTPFITFKNKENQNIVKEVKIYNMTGIQIYSNTYIENDTFSIKNLNLKKGNYLLNVILPSGKNLKEIIIVE